jgi:hypothetical protein
MNVGHIGPFLSHETKKFAIAVPRPRSADDQGRFLSSAVFRYFFIIPDVFDDLVTLPQEQFLLPSKNLVLPASRLVPVMNQ